MTSRQDRGARKRWTLLALVAPLLPVLLWTQPVAAYPQWQFTSGATRCNQCHFAPGGGGLISGYGRDAIGEELSTFAGDGAFLHGKVTLPSRLALGGNLRGAFVTADVDDPAGPQRALFPMQADLNVRVAVTEGISVYASGGLRGRARSQSAQVPDSNFQPIRASRVISREHYLMWRQGIQGAYVRAGRFYAPFGLRMAEHVLYTRRDLGFNLQQESYNLSAGFVGEKQEAHLTVFAPDFLREMGSEEGGVAALYERHLWNDRGALGVQGKYGVSKGVSRLVGGVTGKLHIERLRTLLLGEANLARLGTDLVGARSQMVAMAGFAVLPVRGLVLTVLGERNQVDLKVRDAGYSALTGLFSWFPYPHLELQLMGRLQAPGGGNLAPAFMTQLHYFL